MSQIFIFFFTSTLKIFYSFSSYFCKDNMYGLAAFESLRVENSEERNVRMKSVGLVAKSYKFLKRFVTYLRNQVR
jgi:hypothetical protein